jgi:hypothetical protein
MSKRLDYDQIAPAGIKALGDVYRYMAQSTLSPVSVHVSRHRSGRVSFGASETIDSSPTRRNEDDGRQLVEEAVKGVHFQSVRAHDKPTSGAMSSRKPDQLHDGAAGGMATRRLATVPGWFKVRQETALSVGLGFARLLGFPRLPRRPSRCRHRRHSDRSWRVESLLRRANARRSN